MNRPMTKLEEELLHVMYGMRLIVLLENEDGFRQFRFNQEQFKAVSDAVAKAVGMVPDPNREHHEIGNLELSDEKIDLKHFEGLADYYTK